MGYLSYIIFGLMLVMASLSAPWAFVLALVQFAIEVALQGSGGMFLATSSLANVLIAGVVVCGALRGALRNSQPFYGYFSPVLWISVTIYGWSILSLVWTPARSVGVNEGVNIITDGFPYFVLYVLVVPLLVSSMADWRQICKVMMFMGMLIGLSIVAHPDFSLKGGRGGFQMDAKIQTSPLALSQAGGMIAIFGALFYSGKGNRLAVFLRAGAFFLGAMVTLLSGTRGQALFAAITIIVGIPISRRLRDFRSYVAIVVGIGVMAFALSFAIDYAAGQTNVNRWSANAVADATEVRLANILDLVIAFIGNPMAWVIGLGHNAFSAVTTTEQGYSHNVFIDVLCELGVPMFVLLLIALWKSVTASRALFLRFQESPTDRAALTILFMMLPYLLMIGAKEGNLWSSWMIFTFMIIITRLEMRTREEATELYWNSDVE
jgi:hypothetical protein